jgi:hypothetical protein
MEESTELSCALNDQCIESKADAFAKRRVKFNESQLIQSVEEFQLAPIRYTVLPGQLKPNLSSSR